MSGLKVFISHRAEEDGAIAHVVKNALESLSSNKIEAFVCEQTPGSADWRDWIETEIANAGVLVFLYTDVRADWRWCTYELGLFRGNSNRKPRRRRRASPGSGSSQPNGRAKEAETSPTTGIVCLHSDDIEGPPAPIENVQAYRANSEGIKTFLTDILLKGLFTDGKALNFELATEDGQATFNRHVKNVLTRFLPAVQTNYYAVRMSLGLSRVEKGAIVKTPLDDAVVTGSDDTMRLLDLPNDGGTWRAMYKNFSRRGEQQWLDELKDSVDGIVENRRLQEVMTPFTADGTQYTPILSRTELFRASGDGADGEDSPHNMVAKQLFVIFVPMTATKDVPDIDGFDIESIRLPASIFCQAWNKRSYDVEYDPDKDPDGHPVVYRANRDFGTLYNLNVNELPDPRSDQAFDVTRLLGRIRDCVDEEHLEALCEDQRRVATEIIHRNNPNVLARIPLQFNGNHQNANCANQAFLPRLMWARTVGDTDKPHRTYYLVSYVRHFDRLEQ